ncbi:MAG: Winged helix-turn-helix transcription repressor, HrcA DNA-binding [Oscillospiraceae bacterium]|nr:Winged helix-turn-helix transcription repressor, HrcA DNA-binding [Oscillospiraceae bacterium]
MKVFQDDKAFNVDDRKLRVLAVIIEEYIKTGEPVG